MRKALPRTAVVSVGNAQEAPKNLPDFDDRYQRHLGALAHVLDRDDVLHRTRSHLLSLDHAEAEIANYVFTRGDQSFSNPLDMSVHIRGLVEGRGRFPTLRAGMNDIVT